MGIEVLAPDVNESFSFFSVVPEKSQIRFGLLAIKNVGEGIVEAIIEERKHNGSFESIQDFVARVASKDLNRKSMESLIKAGVFDQFGERNQLLANMERLLEIAKENQRLKNGAQRGLFDTLEDSGAGSETITLNPATAATETELLTWEKELLGLYVTSHPLKRVKNILESRALSIANIMAGEPVSQSRYAFSAVKQRIRIGGIISSVKKIMTKTGKPMLFMGVEDLTERIEVVVFPSLIARNPTIFQENKIVFVTGRLDSRNGERKFIADEVEEIVAT